MARESTRRIGSDEVSESELFDTESSYTSEDRYHPSRDHILRIGKVISFLDSIPVFLDMSMYRMECLGIEVFDISTHRDISSISIHNNQKIQVYNLEYNLSF